MTDNIEVYHLRYDTLENTVAQRISPRTNWLAEVRIVRLLPRKRSHPQGCLHCRCLMTGEYRCAAVVLSQTGM